MSILTEPEVGRAYWVKWKCRDMRYGVELGSDEYVFRGRETLVGKLEFQPIGGGETIYLFDDEIIYCEQD